MSGNPLTFPNFNLIAGEGRCKVSLYLIDTGEGIQALLTGGEKPHIGGSVLSVPRPSLTGQGWSVDLYITPVPNHKDVEVARPLAEKLGIALRKPVAVSAGIHSEQLTPEELKEINNNCFTLIEQALQALKGKSN